MASYLINRPRFNMTCNFKFHSIILICAISSCSFFSSPSFNSFFRLSIGNSAIMTHSSEQNIVSSNFLTDQTAQPPGDQHQGIFLKKLCIQVCFQCRINRLPLCIVWFSLYKP
ncbi:hypothetical protein Hanom_Chr12g01157071 [Helianthus anomalus]